MSNLGKIHAKQKSGQSFEKYMERAAPRYLHGLFTKLAEVAAELKIYQRIKSKEVDSIQKKLEDFFFKYQSGYKV